MFNYPGVITRFLNDNERLIPGSERELPLVIEAKANKTHSFLREILQRYSTEIKHDIACYGAVLLRGFEIENEQQFEQTILAINGMRGIRDAFMAEEGRIPVLGAQYVLHTNAIYKTGGTLYLGGFHSENYYSTDVPSYINFCCLKPSSQGGETGLIHTQKVFEALNPNLQAKLESRAFFVKKWLLDEVADFYQQRPEKIEAICKANGLEIIGDGQHKFILLYKPNVFCHPETGKKSLQINLFELPTLNKALQRCFIKNYQGSNWRWHRRLWQLPQGLFHALEQSYLAVAPWFYDSKAALKTSKFKWKAFQASKKLPFFNQTSVGNCFDAAEVQTLAELLHKHYVSCLWQKGDVLMVDNRQVMHAGMPGKGPRLVRAMICNPLIMQYQASAPGILNCEERNDTIASQITA